MTSDHNSVRARRQMTDDQIREMGEQVATGKYTKTDLCRAYGVGMTVVRRSLDYYDAHLKPKEH